MGRQVDVQDLLLSGARYVVGGRDLSTGVDCLWVALEVQRRRGLRVPAHADLSPAGEGMVVLEQYLARAGAFWPRVDASQAPLLGDVLVYQAGAGRPHALTVVDEDAGRALTCAAGSGLHLVRYSLMGTPTSVHRYRPPPAAP